jgi:hypothetical protein
MFKSHRNDVQERKKDRETAQSDAFAAAGLHLASGIFWVYCGIRVHAAD